MEKKRGGGTTVCRAKCVYIVEKEKAGDNIVFSQRGHVLWGRYCMKHGPLYESEYACVCACMCVKYAEWREKKMCIGLTVREVCACLFKSVPVEGTVSGA